MAQSLRLFDQVRDRIRTLHMSGSTETADVDWIRRFILFHAKQHPRELGAEAVEIFLTDLAVTTKDILQAIRGLSHELRGDTICV